MEDIFNSDFTTEESLELPKMTKDEFIQKTRSMLQVIMDGYSSNWKDKYNEEDEENEENTCSRCNGFLYICEGGVGDVDCPSCKGTGFNNERIFDAENFIEFVEHDVIFGEQPFLDLLYCEIVDTVHN